ncbi:winged helix-turn-helix domain-containing protein [Aquirufa ecclesiirivi]|uniref:winged helix-turn-helix domain-containing protein n=1 Tax=Aquirufa ecclesiirivi TaxID=2715124 RepID=UPI0022A8A907|nr:winged helix-turn-helix domain-containing protein [Aquirufa ecclesiirivi]
MLNRSPYVVASFLVDLRMPVKDLLKQDSDVQIKATLRVFNGEDKLFGPGKLELLQFIQETGSISQAAKKMGLSYKKAWEMVNSLNQLCKSPIVQAQTGGIKGGKTVLTPEGLELMEAFGVLQMNFQQFLEEQMPLFLGK